MGSASTDLLLRIKGDASSAKAAVSEITGGMSSVTKTAAVAGAAMVAAGVGISKAMDVATKAAVDYGTQVVLIQRLTGMSAEESSKWAAILGRYGVEGKKAGLVIKTLSTQIAGHSAGLKDLGIATQTSTGANRTATEVFADLAQKYTETTDKTGFMAVATKTLGRGFVDLLPVLAGGRQGIIDLGIAAEENGLIFSNADLQAVKDYNKALKDNKDSLKGAEIQVGLATLPFETFRAKAIGGLLNELHKLNPELVKTGGAIGSMAGPAGEVAGGLFLGISFLPKFLQGLASLSGPASTVALKAMYAADAVKVFATATGTAATGLALIPFAAGGTIAYLDRDRAAAQDAAAAHSRLALESRGVAVSLHQQSAAAGTAGTAGQIFSNHTKTAATAAKTAAAAVAAETGTLKALAAAKANASREADNLTRAQIAAREAHRNTQAAETAQAEALKLHGRNSREYKKATDDVTIALLDEKDANAASRKQADLARIAHNKLSTAYDGLGGKAVAAAAKIREATNILKGNTAGVGQRGGVLRGDMSGALNPTSVGQIGRVSRGLSTAYSEVGKPYVWGASGPNAFDCSGLVSYLLSSMGFNYGRMTTSTIQNNLAPGPGNAITVGLNPGRHTGISIMGRSFEAKGRAYPILGPGSAKTNWEQLWHPPNFARGGFSKEPSIFGEAGLEVAIPLEQRERARALALYQQTGEMLGAQGGGGDIVVHSQLILDGAVIGEAVRRINSADVRYATTVNRTH